MIVKEMIHRINALYHKRISVGLSEEEKREEEQLRKEYLAAIRAQVQQSMNNIEIVDPDDERLVHKGCSCEEHHQHGPDCQFGHKHKH